MFFRLGGHHAKEGSCGVCGEATLEESREDVFSYFESSNKNAIFKTCLSVLSRGWDGKENGWQNRGQQNDFLLFLVLVAQQGGFEVPGEEARELIISTHAAAFGCDFCEWSFHSGETWVVAFPARGFFSR